MTTVLVTAATGNIGTNLVPALLQHGVTVRALVRSKADAIARFGDHIEVSVGDFADRPSLADAMPGVDRVFLNSADGPDKVAHELAVIDAAVAAGVGGIVKLSSVLAEPGSPLPGLDWHGRIEAHLATCGVPSVVLRANFLMSNVLAARDAIRSGQLPAPAGDGKVSMLDPRDVSALAAAVLATADLQPNTLILTGGQAISYRDVAAELSHAIGRNIDYVDLPPEAASRGFADAGLPSWLVTHLNGAFDLIRRGELGFVTDTVAVVTRRQPHTFAAYARDHVGLFGGGTPAEDWIDGLAAEPQDLARLFINRVNAGDEAGLESLYEPDAILHFPPGNIARGRQAIREALSQILASRPNMAGHSTGVLRLGDLALTTGTWSMTGTAPDGQQFRTGGHTAEIVRRQADGTWRMVIDEPNITVIP
jgi:uncharacterized protein (TIGR02246 family)